MGVGIPLTGAGQSTATVATDQVGGAEYQMVKLVDGAIGSSQVSSVLTTTPGSGAGGLVVRPIGSTEFTQAAVLTAGSSNNVIGQTVLGAGSSANVVGQVVLQQGTTANFQQVQSVAFSSGNVSRSSISTTVDTQLIAANANRKALVIANRSTAQTVGVGFSTAAVTTGLANVDLFIPPSQSVTFGGMGTLPLYKGPLRGINLTSTTVAGSVGVTEFS